MALAAMKLAGTAEGREPGQLGRAARSHARTGAREHLDELALL
jgi:hypothetical protein